MDKLYLWLALSDSVVLRISLFLPSTESVCRSACLPVFVCPFASLFFPIHARYLHGCRKRQSDGWLPEPRLQPFIICTNSARATRDGFTQPASYPYTVSLLAACTTHSLATGCTSPYWLYISLLHCIVLHCVVLCYIALYCTVLHCIVLYCIAQYHIPLHCTVLYYIA